MSRIDSQTAAVPVATPAMKDERGWLGPVLHRASLEALAIAWVQDKATDQELRELRDRITQGGRK